MGNDANRSRQVASDTHLELLYHVSRELASDLDLPTVLHRVLQLSLDAVGGNSGSIIVLDSRGRPVDSAIIHTGQVYDRTTQQLTATLEKGLAGWVARHKEAAIIADTSKDDRWSKRPDDAPDATGPKSAMSMPLVARDELVGVMTLVHPTPGSFTEEHAALMRAITDQAGIAVMNARLYAESRQRARAMTALAESSIAITASLGTEDILQRVMEQVQHALNVQAVALALVEPDRQHLTVRAVAGLLPKKVLHTSIRMGEGVAGRVAESGAPIVETDVETILQQDEMAGEHFGFAVQAVACAPILAQDEVIGTLEAYNPEGGEFEPDAVLVLSGIGSMAGSVIRYARLFSQLEAAHQSYRQLFDDSIDLILITNWEGVIQQFNLQAARTIRASDDLSGRSIFELHDFSEAGPFEELVERLEKGELISYESTVRTDEGSLPVQVYTRRIHLNREEKLQWILHNISERKSIDALRDDLISMIYHDLRSPLANVIYSLDVLETMLPDRKPEVQDLIDVAKRATDRIKRLTSSLLDMKTLESGQPITKRKSVPVQTLFEEALSAVRPLSKTKGQSISLDLDSAPDSVHIDQDMITRVVINLLENAVKYTPRNGRIVTGARLAENDSVEFWVQDNGPGIPEDQLDTIFDKYSRLEGSDLGFGLGLSFCRLAVEGHGGRIWVESGEGSGARFAFRLPRKGAQVQPGH